MEKHTKTTSELLEDHEKAVNLILEAQQVFRETGKTPRQLAEENERLKEAAKEAISYLKSGDLFEGERMLLYKLESAIQ